MSCEQDCCYRVTRPQLVGEVGLKRRGQRELIACEPPAIAPIPAKYRYNQYFFVNHPWLLLTRLSSTLVAGLISSSSFLIRYTSIHLISVLLDFPMLFNHSSHIGRCYLNPPTHVLLTDCRATPLHVLSFLSLGVHILSTVAAASTTRETNRFGSELPSTRLPALQRHIASVTDPSTVCKHQTITQFASFCCKHPFAFSFTSAVNAHGTLWTSLGFLINLDKNRSRHFLPPVANLCHAAGFY